MNQMTAVNIGPFPTPATLEAVRPWGTAQRRTGDPEPYRILMVDDNSMVRGSMARLLARHGFAVIEAASGTEALAACGTERPDLVLLDVQMPGCDGFEVCRRIKQNTASALVPVVLVTALDTAEYRLRGAEAGADDFFTKPAATSELVARVRGAVRLKRITDGMEAPEAILFTLARIVEGRDTDTVGHCNRLSVLGERLGKRLRLPRASQIALQQAGIVHDIGKVVVPDAVLLKRGPLTDDEWTVMRRHAAEGARICAPLQSFRDVLPIIRHHHERMDGSGYPDGLRGHEIPITARVLQVVDVFDALNMSRPYKAALSEAEALAVMETEVRRGWWDPTIFEEFTNMVSDGGLN
jgi:putative two-component system response regulator